MSLFTFYSTPGGETEKRGNWEKSSDFADQNGEGLCF